MSCKQKYNYIFGLVNKG